MNRTAIEMEIAAVADALDESGGFGWFPDMDGTLSVYIEPTEEQNALVRRAEMLTELACLRHPVGREPQFNEFTPDWGMLMHFGECC